ncbi:MarR family winged helix-turn-helix transcriptional regulator [Frigidibacter sp. MR17.24]|uniref:MarR family winged helix-turn-helix transcriptional regulator n=1 Tax=Frigidibacter sp. MR17.24 TaxID=3127345 RepID=UPI003012F60C
MTQQERLEIGLVMAQLARRWRRVLDQRLAPLGHGEAGWPVLVHLARLGGGLTQAELAARIGVDASGLVRVLDALAARGLVERRVDPADRRARRLDLTAAGQAAVAELRPVLVAAEEEMLAGLPDAEAARFLRLLQGVAGRIEGMEGQPAPETARPAEPAAGGATGGGTAAAAMRERVR